MANHNVNNPTYNSELRMYEVTDRGHANVFNANEDVLINNDVYLKNEINTIKQNNTASNSDLNTHKNNTSIHVSLAEKQTWNNKASTSLATTTQNGLMSAADKQTINDLSTTIGNSITGQKVLTEIKKVDGSGSGLDADLLDGKEASAFSLTNHTHSVATTSANGFMSAQQVKDLNDIKSTTSSDTLTSTINSTVTSTQTINNIFTKIKDIDGSGSKLDADLLDGKEASSFATSTHSHSEATETTAGFMSKEDKLALSDTKIKLANIKHEQYNKNLIPNGMFGRNQLVQRCDHWDHVTDSGMIYYSGHTGGYACEGLNGFICDKWFLQGKTIPSSSATENGITVYSINKASSTHITTYNDSIDDNTIKNTIGDSWLGFGTTTITFSPHYTSSYFDGEIRLINNFVFDVNLLKLRTIYEGNDFYSTDNYDNFSLTFSMVGSGWKYAILVLDRYLIDRNENTESEPVYIVLKADDIIAFSQTYNPLAVVSKTFTFKDLLKSDTDNMAKKIKDLTYQSRPQNLSYNASAIIVLPTVQEMYKYNRSSPPSFTTQLTEIKLEVGNQYTVTPDTIAYKEEEKRECQKYFCTNIPDKVYTYEYLINRSSNKFKTLTAWYNAGDDKSKSPSNYRYNFTDEGRNLSKKFLEHTRFPQLISKISSKNTIFDAQMCFGGETQTDLDGVAFPTEMVISPNVKLYNQNHKQCSLDYGYVFENYEVSVSSTLKEQILNLISLGGKYYDDISTYGDGNILIDADTHKFKIRLNNCDITTTAFNNIKKALYDADGNLDYRLYNVLYNLFVVEGFGYLYEADAELSPSTIAYDSFPYNWKLYASIE